MSVVVMLPKEIHLKKSQGAVGQPCSEATQWGRDTGL